MRAVIGVLPGVAVEKKILIGDLMAISTSSRVV